METSTNYVPVGIAPGTSSAAPPIGLQCPKSVPETPPPSFEEIYPSQPNGVMRQAATAPFQISNPNQLGREASSVLCPHCNKRVMSFTNNIYSDLTNCCGALLCVIGWPLCLCCFYFFFVNPEKVEHRCSECKSVIGIVNWDAAE